MKRYSKLLLLQAIVMIGLVFISCRREYSPTTGWEYNNKANGGFEVVPYVEQETGPGLVLIEGGTFVMGRTEQDVVWEWDNIPRRVSVPSFYMDQTEVRNLDYLEYLYWLQRIFAEYPRIYMKALPDTLVWREKLAYNEPLVDYYLRHPAYRDYPVVGVSWIQARDYCTWRTDRVNEQILINYGILRIDPNQTPDENFNTESYLAGQYVGAVRNDLIDLNPAGSGTRIARMEDGILLPRYRLPTEAEWEFAALGLIGNTLYERIVERRLYPWNGHITRTDARRNYGDFVANFMRARGDYMGVAGNLNDAADIPAPVYAYWPNDYGLYNMAGNVSEWVMDVFRPLTFQDMDDRAPFRGNIFETKVLDASGAIDDKLDFVQYDYAGIKEYLEDFQDKENLRNTIKQINEMRIEFTEEESALIERLMQYANDAIDLNEQRRYEDASTKIQDAMDYIENQPSTVSIGPLLMKGISEYASRIPGQLKYRPVTVEENMYRRNYRKADNINYKDGDFASLYQKEKWRADDGTSASKEMYDYTITSMINDRARVYKGGSWRDRAYWLSPGTRRYLDERAATNYIGFRCAMDRVGSPIGKY